MFTQLAGFHAKAHAAKRSESHGRKGIMTTQVSMNIRTKIIQYIHNQY
jgi:hypothetical protein